MATVQQKVISVISTKGGVGKSTIVTNIATEAAAAGRNVIIVNSDTQKSVVYWNAFRNANPALTQIPVYQWKPENGDLNKGIRQLPSGWDLAVIDVCGTDNRALRSAMLAADLIVVPTTPSGADFHVLRNETIPVLKEMHKATKATSTGVIVINMWHWSHRLHRTVTEAMNAMIKADYRICETRLKRLAVFQDAITSGMGVSEYAPKSEAARNVTALYTELMKLIK